MSEPSTNQFIRRFTQTGIMILALVAVGNLGCNSKPKEALLTEVKKSVVLGDPPSLQVIMKGQRIGNVMNVDFNNKLHNSMELLATKFGFRIEMGSIKPNMFMGSVKTYEIKEFTTPKLPGLNLKQDTVGQGISIVNITPDYHREMVIEEATDPKTGMQNYLEIEPSKLFQNASLLKAIGVETTADAMKEIIKVSAEQKGRALKLFVENVERIRQDKGYKRAWFVRYRIKESTSVPTDSPLWDLCDDSVLAGENTYTGIGIIPSGGFRVSLDFWTAHGQLSPKASLQQYMVVAYEGSDGKLAKLEGWNSFL